MNDFVDSTGRVFASWYSGELECAKGKTLFYSKDGFHDICERAVVLTFKSGLVTGFKEYENSVHKGRTVPDEVAKDLRESFSDGKLTRDARVAVKPVPRKFRRDGSVRDWDFKLMASAEVSQAVKDALARELKRMFRKYDFTTYRNCGEWVLPEQYLYTIIPDQLKTAAQ